MQKKNGQPPASATPDPSSNDVSLQPSLIANSLWRNILGVLCHGYKPKSESASGGGAFVGNSWTLLPRPSNTHSTKNSNKTFSRQWTADKHFGYCRALVPFSDLRNTVLTALGGKTAERRLGPVLRFRSFALTSGSLMVQRDLAAGDSGKVCPCLLLPLLQGGHVFSPPATLQET